MLKQASLQGLRAGGHKLQRSLAQTSNRNTATTLGSERCCRTICAAGPVGSIRDIQQGLRSKQLTVLDVIGQYTETIVNSEPTVKSLLSVQFEGAVRKVMVMGGMGAKCVDERACKGLHAKTSVHPFVGLLMYVNLAFVFSMFSVSFNMFNICVVHCTQAVELDAMIAAVGAEQIGPLAGVPITVKVCRP